MKITIVVEVPEGRPIHTDPLDEVARASACAVEAALDLCRELEGGAHITRVEVTEQ